MAIGDTVQAGLGRMDFSVFKDFGRAAFLANQSFGNALGDAAAAYFQGKKKKERAKEIEEDLIRQGYDSETAKAISKNPFLQQADIRRKEAENRLKIAAMQVEAGNKRSSDLLNFEKMMYRDKLQAKAKTERDAESSARLLFDTPKTPEFKELQATYRPEQIPGTPEFIAMQESDPMGARPSIIAKTITEQPDFRRFAKQDSIALTQVPESFKPRARFIQDKVQSGEVSAIQGLGAINKLTAQAPEPLDPFKVSDEKRKATEFKQSQEAITFEPESNFLTLGDPAKEGVNFGISGQFANETEVAKLKTETIPNYQDMNAVMNQLIELGEKRKEQVYMSNADKTLAASLSRQLQGLLREDILGPGTVTDPERQILEQIVQNPTTWMDTAGGTQDKINSLKGIRRNAFNKLKTSLTGLGLKVTEIGVDGSSAINLDNETPTGLRFTEIDLDQL